MAPGEPFRARHRSALERARADVLERHALPVAVYVGELSASDGSSRTAALALLSRYGADADTTVLIAVDPAARRSEIVTGAVARRRVDDRTAALVTASMTSSFAAGDLAGGLVQAVRMLGENARPVRG